MPFVSQILNIVKMELYPASMGTSKLLVFLMILFLSLIEEKSCLMPPFTTDFI